MESLKFLDYEGLKHFWERLKVLFAGKQDSLTEEQQEAVDSGVTSDYVRRIDVIDGVVTDMQKTIDGKQEMIDTVEVKSWKIDTEQVRSMVITCSSGSTLACGDIVFENASSTVDGMMSAADKKKLDGISEGGGSAVTVDSELSDTSENPVQNKVVKAAIDAISGSGSEKVVTVDLTEKTSTDIYAFGNNTEAVCKTYKIITGDSVPQLALATDILWMNGTALTLEANSTYIVSIVSGCANWGKFS